MRHFLTLTFLAIIILIATSFTAAHATIITDNNHTIGLYGVQWENGVPEESRFPEFIELAESGADTEIILENEYLDRHTQNGSTGFIMVANWFEEERTMTYGVDYQGSTLNLSQDVTLPIMDTSENWHIWWIGASFVGGSVLDDITRMFAEINYGEYFISEEITREYSNPPVNPVPEPATMLLFGLGLLGLAGVSRKKQ